MSTLSGDPYSGAYAAYRALNPEATGNDWEQWLTKIATRANGKFDNFGALAEICNQYSKSRSELSQDVTNHIFYSAGYFEAMREVVCALLTKLPTSDCIPHHFERYRAGLIDDEAQFK